MDHMLFTHSILFNCGMYAEIYYILATIREQSMKQDLIPNQNTYDRKPQRKCFFFFKKCFFCFFFLKIAVRGLQKGLRTIRRGVKEPLVFFPGHKANGLFFPTPYKSNDWFSFCCEHGACCRSRAR